MEHVSPASNDGVKMLGTHPENSHIPKHPWLEDEKSFWNDPRLFRGTIGNWKKHIHPKIYLSIQFDPLRFIFIRVHSLKLR